MATLPRYLRREHCRLSGGAGTITVTRPKGARPPRPAGEPLLGFVRVAYQAGGSEIASAHLDVSAVVADRYRCEADGLDVVISAGQALGGGTLRYHFGSTRLTLDPSTTSYLWQLTSGLFEITEDIADRPEPSALLFWEVETDASAVTAIHDHRRYAGRTVCLRLAGATPGSPGTVDELQVEHDLLYVDEVVFRVSDNGGGSAGQTAGEWFVDGTTAYTSKATDDQRPAIAFDATCSPPEGGRLSAVRRWQVELRDRGLPVGRKPECGVDLVCRCLSAADLM